MVEAREFVKLSKSAFGNATLPLLFPKERVPALPYSPNGRDHLRPIIQRPALVTDRRRDLAAAGTSLGQGN
jgi:hypothetical protein